MYALIVRITMDKHVKKLTLAQEYQTLVFELFQTHILSLDGPIMNNDDGIPVVHVSKEMLADKILLLLNEIGDKLASDERFSYEDESGKTVKKSTDTSKE